MRRSLLIAVAILCAFTLGAVENEHVELGTIAWLRDYRQALELAEETGRPVLILFQEVPGCATCRNYGLQVLSHPLLAEAAETSFVPLAIFNNRSGSDKDVLDLFGEPSWNNPVVRIVDADERELDRRLAGDYTPGGLSGSMIKALRAAKQPVPRYLEIAHAEFVSRANLETALFSMYCFWQGEIDLGGIEGVVATRSGFMHGSEVVEVQYDGARLSYSGLLRQAKSLRCADRVFPLNAAQTRTAERILGSQRVATIERFRPDGNIKYYLSQTPYRSVPMSDYQQVLVNRALFGGKDPRALLSPRQLRMAEAIMTRPRISWANRIATDRFAADWDEVWRQIGG